MPRRSEPAPGSVIAIAPTSSPRTSERHPGRPLRVVAVLQHVVRRDLVHALAEAGESRVQQLLVDHALEAEVTAQPAVLGRHVGAEQPGLPRAAPELGIDVAARLPALVIGKDLALDPRPRGLAEELVLVARPGRTGTRWADRGHARIIAPAGSAGRRAKWHSRRVSIGPTTRTPPGRPAAQAPASRGGRPAPRRSHGRPATTEPPRRLPRSGPRVRRGEYGRPSGTRRECHLACRDPQVSPRDFVASRRAPARAGSTPGRAAGRSAGPAR